MRNLSGDIVNLEQYPLSDSKFRTQCKGKLDEDGVLVLDNFLTSLAIASIKGEGIDNQHLAYFTEKNHNIYLSPSDPEFSSDHPRNREVVSSKGCITTDQIPDGSALRVLYDALEFRHFLCVVLDIEELHEYVDPLSSINLHYASNGQELGWHFDNSSFAITLLIQPPEDGGDFEYVRDVRDADQGDMNYQLSKKFLTARFLLKSCHWVRDHWCYFGAVIQYIVLHRQRAANPVCWRCWHITLSRGLAFRISKNDILWATWMSKCLSQFVDRLSSMMER